jgi:hypothetical protein
MVSERLWLNASCQAQPQVQIHHLVDIRGLIDRELRQAFARFSTPNIASHFITSKVDAGWEVRFRDRCSGFLVDRSWRIVADTPPFLNVCFWACLIRPLFVLIKVESGHL